jgi:MFS family permease
MVTIGGLPAHPLIVHAVVVLLPLAALGTLAVAARPRWRRNLGVPVFLVALVGVAAVPLATETGEQLQGLLGGGGPLVEVHEQRADHLLPYAVLFLVLLLATLVLGRLADRAAAASQQEGQQKGRQEGQQEGRQEGQLRGRVRLTTSVGVLAAAAGLVVTGLVVWIGDAGATAVWSGVGG